MVARVIPTKSINRMVQYNEHKLQQGIAELIHAGNYLKETQDLGFTDKLQTLQRQAALNERTQVNGVHITLNFPPTEKLEKETLIKIADNYMQRIGFGNQPYLVYEHKDAGHPHIHIATTNIQNDGTRISLHNIGKHQSEKARVAIEKEFKLVKAQHQQLKQEHQLKPLKIEYGRTETKRAICNVLKAVIPGYKYTSLPELNAVLRLYNMVADRGKEDSRTYQKNGLVYRVLNEKGEKVGVPIKASDFYFKPGLKVIKAHAEKNEPLRQPHKQRLKNAIDFALLKLKGKGIAQLIRELQKEQIHVVLRQNEKGTIYGVTYVDHQTKTVFNGSDLGKPYSANGIQHRTEPLNLSPKPEPHQLIPEILQQQDSHAGQTITDILLADQHQGSLAAELKQNQHKRKRKRLRH